MANLVNDVINDFYLKEPDVSSPYYSTILFEGAVNLIATPPFDICFYLQLLRYLRDIEYVRILSTCGNFEEESIVSINLLILEPSPLFSILMDIPGIKDAKVLTGDELSSVNPLDFLTFGSEEENQQEIQILLSFDDCLGGNDY